MATGLDRYHDILRKNLENLPPFSQRPYYEPEGDSLIFSRGMTSHTPNGSTAC